MKRINFWTETHNKNYVTNLSMDISYETGNTFVVIICKFVDTYLLRKNNSKQKYMQDTSCLRP